MSTHTYTTTNSSNLLAILGGWLEAQWMNILGETQRRSVTAADEQNYCIYRSLSTKEQFKMRIVLSRISVENIW